MRKIQLVMTTSTNEQNNREISMPSEPFCLETSPLHGLVISPDFFHERFVSVGVQVFEVWEVLDQLTCHLKYLSVTVDPVSMCICTVCKVVLTTPQDV